MLAVLVILIIYFPATLSHSVVDLYILFSTLST